MRLPPDAHWSRPWRIHQIAAGFRLEDVWSLPIEGQDGDFSRLVSTVASFDPSGAGSGAARTLWQVREMLGERLGWDRPEGGIGHRVSSLAGRLPADLRGCPTGPVSGALPARPLYLLADEWAVEVANQTVHGVLHFGWIPTGEGTYRAQMAVLVRPNGLLGRAYLAAIRPFRYLVVYPALIGDLVRGWRERQHVPA